MRRILYLLILISGILVTVDSLAEDVNFEVSADRNKVSLGSGVTLSLSFHGTQDISAPELPDIDGFNWRYLGPSTRMSIVNGKVSSSITHMYTLVALKVGNFKIPSISVQYRGETYSSKPISIEVLQGPVSRPQLGEEETPEDTFQGLEDRVFLVMDTAKQKAYVNEIIPLTIKLYIQKLAIRDIQYPEFSHEGFSAGKYDEPTKYQDVMDGVAYDIIEFNANIFGMRPGELRLGPAELKCNLIVKKESRRRPSSFFDDDFFGRDIFSDFFGRYETYPLNLKAADIPLTIMALPEEDRPADFSGALGNYEFYIEAEPKEVKLGDPITLRMTVTGEGNFKTVNTPFIDLKDDFKVYEPEIRQEDQSKTFEQVLIPKSDDIKEIPEVSLSFFDTKVGGYKRITRGPIPIKVNPLPKGEQLRIFEIPEEGLGLLRKRETLGRDIIYIKDAPGELKVKEKFLYKAKWFIAFLFIPLLAIISILVIQRRKERLEGDIRYARRLRAPRKAKKNLLKLRRLLSSKEKDTFFDTVFKTLQEYLGDKFHLATAGITSDVIEELKARNIDREILDSLEACFKNCDMARYAPASIAGEEMTETFRLLEEIIDRLERMRI